MFPTFGTDCTLLVINTKTEASQLLQGDIAVVDISGAEVEFDQIAHSVVTNLPEQEKFSTRGDNPVYYDYPSSIDGFFGYDKFGGKVVNYFSLPEQFCN